MTIEATRPESPARFRFEAMELVDDPIEVAPPLRDPQPSTTAIGSLGSEALHEICTPPERASGARTAALAALSDAVGLGCAALFATWLVSLPLGAHSGAISHPSFGGQLVWLAACIPVLTVVLAPSRARWVLRTTLVDQIYSSALALAAGCTVCLAGWQLVQAAGAGRAPTVDALLFMGLFGLISVALVRFTSGSLPARVRSDPRRILIVGSGIVADRVSSQLVSSLGIEVVGFVDDDPMDDRRCLGKLADLAFECERRQVDHVVVAFSRSRPEQIIDALRGLQGRLPITIVPRLFDVLPSTATVHDLGSGLAGISVTPATLGRFPNIVKRTFDVVGATTALIVLGPLLALAAVAIRVTSRGPVVLRQTRVGRDGKAFEMLKFRSMVVDPPLWDPQDVEIESVAGPFPKLKNDPRVTRVGRLMRRTSTDELPQLWNVLRGQMSMVGPRPFIPDDAVWIEGWAERRYSVRPGMTGLWQVSGRNDLSFEDMCRLDHLYVSSWSPGLDMRILLQTVRAVTHGRGAY